MQQPGIELATSRSQVRRPKHYRAEDAPCRKLSWPASPLASPLAGADITHNVTVLASEFPSPHSVTIIPRCDGPRSVHNPRRWQQRLNVGPLSAVKTSSPTARHRQTSSYDWSTGCPSPWYTFSLRAPLFIRPRILYIDTGWAKIKWNVTLHYTLWNVYVRKLACSARCGA